MYMKKKIQELINLFMRVNNRFNEENKVKRLFGTDVNLYPSEIHTIDAIGRHEGVNVTDLASIMGVTKGAISQVIRKLEKKGLVERYRYDDNHQQVLLKLSEKGKVAFQGHNDFHKRQYQYIFREMGDINEKDIEQLLKVFTVIEKSFDVME